MVYGHDREVCQWAKNHGMDAGDCRAVGIARDGKLIGAILWFNYRHPDIEVGMLTVEPWATRGMVRELASYPFRQLGCERVTAIVHENNTRVRKFLERQNFQREGVKRRAFPDGDGIMYGILKHECKWS